MHKIDLFKDYENARLIDVEEHRRIYPDRTYYYDELGDKEIEGIPISLTRDGTGRLVTTFIPDTHLLAIGATRSGKTTGYVIPTMNVLLKKKNKPSLVISDPKNELYSSTAEKFMKEGYRVLHLDFTDYTHSDCWNPLIKLYRKYRKYLDISNEIVDYCTRESFRVEFKGRLYTEYLKFERAINEEKENILGDIDKDINELAAMIIPITSNDPYWDVSSQDLFKAILYGMLEDTEDGSVTERTFNLDTLLTIIDMFGDGTKTYDNGYFQNRPKSGKAYCLADKCIIQQASNTRRCILSSCVTKLNKFRSASVRRIFSNNTFEIDELDSTPTVIFISFKDEEGSQYDIISMFLSGLYTELIALARSKSARLDRPFYFLLDEFGNLPKFNDFDKVISACGGRNIWFMLVLQSYAQLENVYGSATANIIKDNLNTHIFFGTNNPETKQAFSNECGKKTVISPLSAFNGDGETIERFDKDTVALVPVSMLDRIKECQCIVTQMREDVMMSRIERCYMCPEFASDNADPRKREVKLAYSDERYEYRSPSDVAEDDEDCDLF